MLRRSGECVSVVKRLRLLLVLIVALLVGGALFLLPSVRWPVYGWIKGEAFYEGRPTSYWRLEALKLIDWQEEQATGRTRQPSWVDRLLPTDGPFLFANEVLEGDAAFQPVLTEMLKDQDPRVRKQAAWGLAKLGAAKARLK